MRVKKVMKKYYAQRGANLKNLKQRNETFKGVLFDCSRKKMIEIDMSIGSLESGDKTEFADSEKKLIEKDKLEIGGLQVIEEVQDEIKDESLSQAEEL